MFLRAEAGAGADAGADAGLKCYWCADKVSLWIVDGEMERLAFYHRFCQVHLKD